MRSSCWEGRAWRPGGPLRSWTCLPMHAAGAGAGPEALLPPGAVPAGPSPLAGLAVSFPVLGLFPGSRPASPSWGSALGSHTCCAGEPSVPTASPCERRAAAVRAGAPGLPVRGTAGGRGLLTEPPAAPRGTHLWEFIRDILIQPELNEGLLKWEDRREGVFKFLRSEAVAQLWGQKKKNSSMTYEKLSRAMR